MDLRRAKRSIFAVPGNSSKMIGKSRNFQVDQIFYDLEDAVSASEKSSARTLLWSSFLENSGMRKEIVAGIVSIRVNSMSTSWFEEDMELLAAGVGREIDSIIFPKASSREEMNLLDARISAVEKVCGLPDRHILVDAQIETALGVVNAENIASSPRVASLSFGPADFMADVGMPSSRVTHAPAGYEGGDIFHYPMMKILIAARAAGIAAIDGPTLEVHSVDFFLNSAKRAYALGFDGKWILHPSQIEPCHEIFTPSQSSFDQAMVSLQAYDYFTSQQGGNRGAFMHNGAMVDEATRKMSQRIASRGMAAGLVQSENFKTE